MYNILITREQSDELIRITSQKLKKMFDDKRQTPKLLIPKYLPTFVKTKNYQKFIQSVFVYCTGFNQIMKQYNKLKSKMQNRVGEQTSLLRKQKQDLGKLQREVSYNYAAIIIQFNMQCMQQDRRRSNFKDQVFFQALIYLVQRVMKQLFMREDFVLVQQQINRLFRTNRYNLIKKRHESDQILHKYPALKQQHNKNKNNLSNILNRAPERITAFKKYQKQKRNYSIHQDYTQTLGIPKQLHNADMQQRSPLICTWLPSRKSMLGDFTHSSNYSSLIQANQKKNTYHTISQETSNGQIGYEKQDRSRIASIGNNLMISNHY